MTVNHDPWLPDPDAKCISCLEPLANRMINDQLLHYTCMNELCVRFGLASVAWKKAGPIKPAEEEKDVAKH